MPDLIRRGWIALPHDVQAIAEEVLTDAQLEAWKLELAGRGVRHISWTLNLSPTSVRNRLDNAHRNLMNAGVTCDQAGNWRVETAA